MAAFFGFIFHSERTTIPIAKCRWLLVNPPDREFVVVDTLLPAIILGNLVYHHFEGGMMQIVLNE
jgi:hypothetical protein